MKLISSLLLLLALSPVFAAESFTVVNSTLRTTNGTLHLTTYNDKFPPEIHLPEGSKIKSCRFRGRKCSGHPVILKLEGKVPKTAKEATLDLRFTTGGKEEHVKLSLFPEAFPKVDQQGESKAGLPLIFSVSAIKSSRYLPCHLFILSPRGELEFYRSLPEECHDFRPHRVGDKTFYSYLLVGESMFFVGYMGPRVILDSDFNEVRRIPVNTDFHEFLLLGPDHWVSFEVELNRLASGKVYFDRRLRERKDGQIIFDWGSSDIVKQFNSEAATGILQTVFRKENVVELFHLNSIQRLGDTGFLVGLGHDGVGYLDRKTRKLTWVLGGIYDTFQLDMPKHPLFNHTPTFNEKTGELTLFSNRSWGFSGKSPPRILRYKLDVENNRLISVKNLRVSQEDVFIHLMGSVQVTGPFLSIGYGAKKYTPYDFVEAHENGKDNWMIALGDERLVYRFYREPFGE